MKTRFWLIALTLAALALAACRPAGGSPEGSLTLEGTRWVLLTIDGQPPLAGTQLTAEFSADQVSGRSGCNSYSGRYEATGRRLTVEEVAMTLMACSGPVMDQEQAFLGALGSSPSYRLTDDRLELLDQDGKAVLVLVPPAPAPEVTLEGTD